MICRENKNVDRQLVSGNFWGFRVQHLKSLENIVNCRENRLFARDWVQWVRGYCWGFKGKNLVCEIV